MSPDRAFNVTPASSLRHVTWHKSSRSNPNGNCVEIGRVDGGRVAVRNSRDPDGPALIFTPEAVTGCLQWLRDGEFREMAD